LAELITSGKGSCSGGGSDTSTAGTRNDDARPPPNSGCNGGPKPTIVKTTQLDVAKTLVKPGGTGTQADADVVAAALARLPLHVLEYMSANGVHLVAVKNSVTDYYTDLKGVRPRGWPPGSSWDSVPGVASGKEVVIATRNGRVPPTGDGHGSYDLVIHETFHGIDAAGSFSSDPEFRAAHDADTAKLDDYLNQAGDAGYEETFAESAAHYFRGDTAWFDDKPHLKWYWETHADRIKP
jgi:hypothetical protein